MELLTEKVCQNVVQYMANVKTAILQINTGQTKVGIEVQQLAKEIANLTFQFREGVKGKNSSANQRKTFSYRL
jgi:hypothetical protein